MSAAVYYQPDLINDDYRKENGYPAATATEASSNPLPPLAKIMPVNQQPGPEENVQAASYTNSAYLGYYQNSPKAQSDPGYMHMPPGLGLTYNATNYVALVQGQNPMLGATQAYNQQQKKVYSTKMQLKCTCKLNQNRIPRPRNAFILFRQKYHQLVLDELSEAKTNPEVLRELGRRWRALSVEERAHWTNLAEEEKKNHAKRYPNYRYTPRRNGKSKHCQACQTKKHHQLVAQQQALGMDMTQQRSPLSQPQLLPHQVQAYQMPPQQQHQPENAYMLQKYMIPGSYQPVQQYGFGENNFQLPQQPAGAATHYEGEQLLPSQAPGPAQAYQNSVYAQQPGEKPAYAEKMLYGYENLAGQYYDQAAAAQRYNALPTPMTNNSFNGHDMLNTIPTLLQHYLISFGKTT